MRPLSERMLLTVDEGGDYWDGDVDENDIEQWGNEAAALERQVKRLRGQLLHCEAFDETATEHTNGEDWVWDALTQDQQDYWIALAAEEEA